MREYNSLKSQEKISFLMKPIVDGLKENGGQLETKELKRIVVENNKEIPKNVLTDLKISRKSGRRYLPFNFSFNRAVKNLILAGIIERPEIGTVVLTEKGRNFKGSAKTLQQNVYKISLPIINKHKNEKLNKHKNEKLNQDSLMPDEDEIENDSKEIDGPDLNWKSTLLNALQELSPAKFEMFCRALIKRMNVDIDKNKGTKLTNDGGIDGYGYITTDDFRTARVAIQAKKWSLENSISSPEIDKFRGAMDKFHVEYGIFITTSNFTPEAVKASREGTHVITLIDGDRLTDLIAKYHLYVVPETITTYRLDKFFEENN